MADHTHIEWTEATWNVVTGCSVVSPGCTNCYAMKPREFAKEIARQIVAMYERGPQRAG